MATTTIINFIIMRTELNVITVNINGAARQLHDSTHIAALIEEMGLSGKRIALERNGEIVPRSSYATQQLADGDKLEVVVAVGGG